MKREKKNKQEENALARRKSSLASAYAVIESKSNETQVTPFGEDDTVHAARAGTGSRSRSRGSYVKREDRRDEIGRIREMIFSLGGRTAALQHPQDWQEDDERRNG